MGQPAPMASRPWGAGIHSAAKVAACGALGTPRSFDILQWFGGSVHRPERSLATATRAPPADGSGRQGRVDADDSALLGWS